MKIPSSFLSFVTGILAGVLCAGVLAHAATTIGTNISTAGTIGIGTTSPSSQLDLEGWTVASGAGASPDFSSGNPQLEINGSLDTTAAPAHFTGLQGIWNTVGNSGSTSNVNGMRLQLDAGYTGSGISRVLVAQNYVAGSHSLGIGDVQGTIGATIESQGASTGDNIGTYTIANGAANYNFAIYARSFQQSGTQVGNIGVVGNTHGATYNIGGLFTTDASGGWYPADLGASAALVADNGNSGNPVFLAKVANVNTFQVTSTGGIFDQPSADATSLWQVQNHAGTTFFDLDSTNGRVGIGTTTPATKLQVSSGASATTTVTVGELGLTSSKACVNMNRSDGGAGSFYISAAGTLVVESNYCR